MNIYSVFKNEITLHKNDKMYSKIFTIFFSLLVIRVFSNNEKIRISEISWGKYLSMYSDLEIKEDSYINFKNNIDRATKYESVTKTSVNVTPFLHIADHLFTNIFTAAHNYYKKVEVTPSKSKITSSLPLIIPNNFQFSWIEKGIVTSNNNYNFESWIYPVKNLIESIYYITYGYNINLDMMNILKCSNEQAQVENDYFISPYHFLQFSINNLILSSDYKRTQGNICISSSKFDSNELTDIDNFLIGNVGKITTDVNIYRGPIVVELSLDQNKIKYYDESILKIERLNETANYYGLIVGYGKENDESYWLIQTSFGSSWGINGCFKLSIDSTSILTYYQIIF